MGSRRDNCIDINLLRHKVKRICKGVYYGEDYYYGEPELIAEGINIVYKVLSEVTGIEYGEITDD